MIYKQNRQSEADNSLFQFWLTINLNYLQNYFVRSITRKRLAIEVSAFGELLVLSIHR